MRTSSPATTITYPAPPSPLPCPPPSCVCPSDTILEPSSKPDGTEVKPIKIESPTPSDILHRELDPTVLDIFRASILRGDLADIPQRIVDAVTTPTSHPTDPETLNVLTIVLSQLGIDFTQSSLSPSKSEYDSKADPESTIPRLTCARCLQQYIDAENGASACVRPHAPPYVSSDGITTDAEGRTLESRYYSCCGFMVSAYPSHPYGGVCYSAPHVSSDSLSLPRLKNNFNLDLKKGRLGTLNLNRKHGVAVDASSPTHRLQLNQAQQAGGQARLRILPARSASDGLIMTRRRDVSNERTTAAAPATTNSSGGSPFPTTSMSTSTASSPSTASGLIAPSQPSRLSQQLRRLASGKIGSDTAASTAAQRQEGRAPVRRAKIVQTIPWQESSLYHPDGWIEVPSTLRRRCGDPPYV